MFYYLILNSSPIKKKNQKDKMVFTLIGGSLIYLVLHAFLSFSFKKDFVKYIWFLFLIDVSAVFLSSDFQGFSSMQISQNTDKDIYVETNIEETQRNTKFNSQSSNLKQPENQAEDESENESLSKDKKPNSSSKKTRKKILKKNRDSKIRAKNNSLFKDRNHKAPKKQVKFEDSTPITQLNNSQEDTYNQQEAENINLTLESLENLNLELGYPDENENMNVNPNQNRDSYEIPKMPKKKMEDEYSDIGSELDLEKFENAVANS